MKKLLTVLLILGLALSACDNGSSGGGGGSDTPKKQNSPNVTMFAGKTATIKSEDTFTTAQWNAIVNAIVNKFSTAYNSVTAQQKEAYEDVLDQGVTVTVEKNPQGYTNYKTNSYTLYVHSDRVNNLDAHKVIVAMATGNGTIDGSP